MRVIVNSISARTNIRNNINEIIQDMTKSTNIEIGAYNYSIKESNIYKIVKSWDNPYFVEIYLNRIKSIYYNLVNNQSLITQIQEGTIKSKNVAFMTHQELNPDKWDELIKKKIERDRLAYDTQIEAATDTFRCRKCKSNKCTYYQMQTRSADEPMTTFVSCIECGNRWKC